MVDTNIIVDLFTDDPRWYGWSLEQLSRLNEEDTTLLVNPIIYAELSVRHASREELDGELSQLLLEYEETPRAALFLAGRAFLRYRKSGGAKSSPLPDFFIGAHAEARGYRIVTRDPDRYRAYFPDVPLITPQA